MSAVKVFAMYLPQYHETSENSLFWGEGFTDWVSTQNAEQLFEGHEQPKRPLNDNYYDLSQKRDIKWQADLAKKYGISGWGIYHYWFNSKQCALTKPAEILLENKDIEIPFFLAWDNASWKRTWSKLRGNDWSPLNDVREKDKKTNEPEILMEYILGEEDEWVLHFEYLLPFFKDDRYIKENGKPIFLIYNYSKDILKMMECWNSLAIKNGFEGIKHIFSYNPFHGIPQNVYKFRYEPLFSGWGSFQERILRKLFKKKEQKDLKIYSYDAVWKKILQNAKRCKDIQTYYGAFVNYDDTPRRGKKGKIILGATPEKFEKYLKDLISICDRQDKKYIFLTAWNEWGEGAYMEPDSIYAYEYLDAFSEVIK